MSFPRYPKYKDSGVEWLGEVPEGWCHAALRHVCRRITDGSHFSPKSTDEGKPYVTVRNLEAGKIDLMGAAKISEDDFSALEKAGCRPSVDDVLFSKDGTVGKVAIVEDDDFVALSSLAIISPDRKKLTSSYLYYFLQSANGEKQIESLYAGADLRRITLDAIVGIWLPLPEFQEQHTIATFLDRETAKIDALVAEQENLIALLKQKRQAVISHAVTKGLDPMVPMKDSGVEWLGEVPAHWEVGPLKRFWFVTDCKHVTAEFVEDGIPLASIREVQSRWVCLDNAKNTTEFFYELLIEGGRLPLPGDLIFSRNATVGEVAQVHASHPRFAMGQDVVLLRKGSPNFSSNYFQQTLSSISTTQQLAVMMIGSTFKRINVQEIRSIIVPAPPVDEQLEISAFIDTETAKLDDLTTEAQRTIDLLKERRSALISEAVTGKIDVRGYHIHSQPIT